jgi:hypothetical protein
MCGTPLLVLLYIHSFTPLVSYSNNIKHFTEQSIILQMNLSFSKHSVKPKFPKKYEKTYLSLAALEDLIWLRKSSLDLDSSPAAEVL